MRFKIRDLLEVLLEKKKPNYLPVPMQTFWAVEKALRDGNWKVVPAAR